MSEWKVGTTYQVTRRWQVASLAGLSELSGGTASFRAHCVDQTLQSRVYVQSNGTLSGTPHNFPLTYTSGVGWTGLFTPGLPLRGLEVTLEASHSLSVIVLPESHTVTSSDEDDLYQSITGTPVPVGLNFG